MIYLGVKMYEKMEGYIINFMKTYRYLNHLFFYFAALNQYSLTKSKIL
jgi:hypothetical protein